MLTHLPLGLFRALNHLSPLPAERYAEAGQNKDIQLADIHLVFKQTRTLDEEVCTHTHTHTTACGD
jgi:hypothetical protein